MKSPQSVIPALPPVSLPAKYEAAKVALSECESIDECKDWADKAAALASYARQADDVELENMAKRIKVRAVRQCGKLLREFEKAQGKHWKSKKGGTSPSTSRKAAASKAGLSPDQAKNAIRVSRVDPEEFEESVESDAPPTITEMAKRGTRKRKPDIPMYEKLGMTLVQFQAGMYVGGWADHQANTIEKYSRKYTIDDVVNGITQDKRQETKRLLSKIADYIGKLMKRL